MKVKRIKGEDEYSNMITNVIYEGKGELVKNKRFWLEKRPGNLFNTGIVYRISERYFRTSTATYEIIDRH